MDTNQLRIIVGVAGREDSAAAVRFAVDEARRRHLPMHLVHVLHPFLVNEDNLTATTPEPVVRKARQMLDDVAAQVRSELGSDAPVSTDLVVGHAAASLADLSHQAAVFVLQPEGVGQHLHIPTYSVTNAVIARTRPPVVAVPAGWSEPGTGAVTVGVDAVGGAVHLLRAAFEEAQARGVALRVVHAWQYSQAFDDVVFEGERQANHSSRLADEIREDLAAFEQKFSGVPVELSVQHGRAADAIAKESKRSSLVVVGRHRTSRRVSRHLGSIVRAVLRGSQCPVMVVDPIDSDPSAEDPRS